MKFNVSIHAVLECESATQAAVHADIVKKLVHSPVATLMLKSNGVKVVGVPSVSKPEEKK